MPNITYKTKEECIKAINQLIAKGKPIPQSLWALYNTLVNSPTSSTPIWDTLQANYPYGSMPQEKMDCVESTVEELLKEGENAEEPVLLLGKIQCGKTDTFEDIIGLSFDKGVDIAIVLTKGTNALVNQTIKRMKNDYRWFKPSDDLNQIATIDIYDIMEIDSDGLSQAIVDNRKVVIICKKQAVNMKRLIDLFERKSPFLIDKKVIIVDDEADFASRNYQALNPNATTDRNGNPIANNTGLAMATISQQIDDFRRIPTFCRYLQVTATPYCLYLQPEGELNLNGNIIKPFRPRFTSVVPTHEFYIGGQQYFIDSADPVSMYSHLYHRIEQKCIDILGHEDKRYLNNAVTSPYIYGLTYALVAYFMATAIRRIQARAENKDYKSSAIIHVQINKKYHDWQKRIVERLIRSIKEAVVDQDKSDPRIWQAIDTVYQDFVESNGKGRNQGLITVEMPPKDAVLTGVSDILSPRYRNYCVKLVNSDGQVVNLLDDTSGELKLDCAANIFIGGNILDRGVTIKNMLCFFYGRNPRNFQQDTVLQHARMYGARSKEDMAVMRLHTTSRIYKILVRMNELDEQLRQWFLDGRDQADTNAVFVGYDNNIKPCAPQKIKASNALMLKPQKRILPVGFWTGARTKISDTIDTIHDLIVKSPGYNNQDQDGFFEMDKERAVEIINLIATTYVYDNKKFSNEDRANDIKEMLCAIEYCTDKSNGKLWALHREGRNMNRLRQNGGYIDAPDDGRTDLAPARSKSTNMPVIMFIQQNGNRCDNNGINIGWNNAPFYWPVLLTQHNINPVLFAIEQKQ